MPKKKRTTMEVKFMEVTLFKIMKNKTTDGISFGLKDKELGDVHVTILHKNGKLGWHITDATGERKYPLDAHIENELFLKRYFNRLIRLIKKYHGNKKAYVMSDGLEQEYNSFVEKYKNNEETMN